MPILRLVAVGFTPEQLSVAVVLLALTSIAAVFTGLGSMLGAVANASGRFLLPAVGPVVPNVAALVCILTLRDLGIIAWALGVLIGSVGAFVMLAVHVRREIALPRLHSDLAKSIRSITQAALPFIYLSAVLQASVLLVRAIASTLAPGTITALSIAQTLATIPTGLVAYALGTVLVPALTSAHGSDSDRFRSLWLRSHRLLAFMLAPVGALMIVLADPIVRVLFGRGAFGETAVSVTAESLRLYAFSLVAQATVVVAHRSLLSAGGTRQIAVLGTLSAIFLVGLTIVLAVPFRHLGIAGAYVAGATLDAVLLGAAAARRFGTSVVLSAIVAAGRSWGLAAVVAPVAFVGPLLFGESDPVRSLAAIVIGSGLFLICFALAAIGARDPGLLELRRALPRLRG